MIVSDPKRFLVVGESDAMPLVLNSSADDPTDYIREYEEFVAFAMRPGG